MAIRKLTPVIHEKVWGSPQTEPWLDNPTGRSIGEIWFSAPEAMPVLVKFLFTSERLSVQVHPDDAYAQAHGENRGKTEMWHILRADLDATIALGLRESASRELVRQAALDGSIVNLLNWIPARAGDTFFVPAGTIHAIGGGLVLCEVQQYSDVTYRLFDYHRMPERTLHLEDSLAVAQLGLADGRRQLPVECEYFRTERLEVRGAISCATTVRQAMYIAIAGEGTISGQTFHPGEAWLVSVNSPPFAIESSEAAFVVASFPGRQMTE